MDFSAVLERVLALSPELAKFSEESQEAKRMIAEVLRRISDEFQASARQPLTENPLASFIRREAVASLANALGPTGLGLKIQGSPGQGNWAQIPWIAVFDPLVTTSAERGYYIVYLFNADQSAIHLSLNQGATSVRKEFGGQSINVLRERARLMRRRLPDFELRLRIHEISLGSSQRLPAGYEAGHALGVTYQTNNLPDEDVLESDLHSILNAYRALTFRGGIEGDEQETESVHSDFSIPGNATLLETRRYVLHRKIERNGTAAKTAKKFHGVVCQACDLDFAARYGTIGAGFIEAHHLRPIGSLAEGVPVSYDVANDFAVLCSNCHRMIHRTDDPSDLSAFRKLLIT